MGSNCGFVATIYRKGVSRTQIEIHDESKRVCIWLSAAESESVQRRTLLNPLFKAYTEKKYLVAVYESGAESLEELTRELILYNRTRLRELETAREKKPSC